MAAEKWIEIVAHHQQHPCPRMVEVVQPGQQRANSRTVVAVRSVFERSVRECEYLLELLYDEEAPRDVRRPAPGAEGGRGRVSGPVAGGRDRATHTGRRSRLRTSPSRRGPAALRPATRRSRGRSGHSEGGQGRRTSVPGTG